MTYPEIHRLMELYVAKSCAFDQREKALLRHAFPKMKPKTQISILKSLASEHESHMAILQKLR